MSDINVNDDEEMLATYGYTKDELLSDMLNGIDIGDKFDGDPMEILG